MRGNDKSILNIATLFKKDTSRNTHDYRYVFFQKSPSNYINEIYNVSHPKPKTGDEDTLFSRLLKSYFNGSVLNGLAGRPAAL